MDLPVMPPVAPMAAKPVPTLPDGPWSFEPKWNGFRTIVFRDSDEVELGSRKEQPMTRYASDGRWLGSDDLVLQPHGPFLAPVSLSHLGQPVNVPRTPTSAELGVVPGEAHRRSSAPPSSTFRSVPKWSLCSGRHPSV